MGNTVSLAYKKFQYQLDEYLKDPEAENHAKQLKLQADQDAAVAKRKAKTTEEKEKADAEALEKKIAADALTARSRFSSPMTIISKIASSILSTFFSLIVIGIALYAGKLEANKAMGYSIPMRILSFIYGAVFFFFVIPKCLYEIYWLNKPIPDYAFLPLTTYMPVGNLEYLFFGPFSYIEDANIGSAHTEVMELYKKGFAKSTEVTSPTESNPGSPSSPAPATQTPKPTADTQAPPSPVASPAPATQPPKPAATQPTTQPPKPTAATQPATQPPKPTAATQPATQPSKPAAATQPPKPTAATQPATQPPKPAAATQPPKPVATQPPKPTAATQPPKPPTQPPKPTSPKPGMKV
jgi:hypothetical protein